MRYLYIVEGTPIQSADEPTTDDLQAIDDGLLQIIFYNGAEFQEFRPDGSSVSIQNR